MIEAIQICKDFSLNKKQQYELGIRKNQLRVLHDVSFECRPGRIFSLLGPNGAGKTTTLRIIATILKASSGQVKVCGIDLNENPSEARRRMGFLTGTTGLYERLTPNELINYFGSLNGMDGRQLGERKTIETLLTTPVSRLHILIGKLSVVTMTPMTFLIILPAAVGMIPGIEYNAITALIPVVNITLATKEIIAGTIHLPFYLITVISLIGLAAVSVLFCARWFGKESNILR